MLILSFAKLFIRIDNCKEFTSLHETVEVSVRIFKQEILQCSLLERVHMPAAICIHSAFVICRHCHDHAGCAAVLIHNRTMVGDGIVVVAFSERYAAQMEFSFYISVAFRIDLSFVL